VSDDNRKDPWLGEAGSEPNTSDADSLPVWERGLIEKLALGLFKEQRKTRRWGIFFKSLTFAYLAAIFVVLMPDGPDGSVSLGKGSHTALINIRGVIADNTDANADNIISSLRSAYKDKNTKGIILRINSPGGSPVQAGYINDEILRLKEKNPDIPVYAVITDICASGGYYIAVAADKIYADKGSIVGSIGVLMDGFGFVGAMDKLGVERRLITAGSSKGFLDPFSPVKEKDQQHIKTMLGNIHQQFIDTVKQGRGDRLKQDKRLFTGLVWTGEQSVTLGLIDDLGSSSYVAREIFEAEKIVDFTRREQVLERLIERLGVTIANTFSGISAGQLR